jgi:hypothetical protein
MAKPDSKKSNIKLDLDEDHLNGYCCPRLAISYHGITECGCRCNWSSHRMFDRFDHDKDGLLQRNEFSAALSLMGLKISTQQIDMLMQILVCIPSLVIDNPCLE